MSVLQPDSRGATTFSSRDLLDALKAVTKKDFKYLGTHPLAKLQIVHEKRPPVGQDGDINSLGLALERTITAAINSLSPNHQETEKPLSDTAQKEQIYHTILRERFINGFGTEYLTDLLAMSRRQYFREQNRAIERLSTVLREWEFAYQERNHNANKIHATGLALIKQAMEAITANYLAMVTDQLHETVFHQRDEILEQVRIFLQSEKSGFVLTGRSGVGKTSFLRSLPNQLADHENIQFLMFTGAGVDIQEPLEKELNDELAFHLGPTVNRDADFFNELTHNAELAGLQVVLVIDGINEHLEGDKLLYRVDQLIRSGRYPWLKIIISCRTGVWRVLKRPLTLAREKYFQQTEGSDPIWYKPSELDVRLPVYSYAELEAVYDKYRAEFQIQTAYKEINFNLRNALRDPLLMRLVAETHRAQAIPSNLRVIDIYPAFIKALLASKRLLEEDIIFLEQELIPLMINNGRYQETITSTQIHEELTSSGERLWKYIISREPAGWGKYTNDSFTRLIDAGILSYHDEAISFQYARFYDYYIGDRLIRDMRLKNVTKGLAFEMLAEMANENSHLTGPLQLALRHEIEEKNNKLINELSQMDSPYIRDQLISTLTYYGLDHRVAVKKILSKLVDSTNSRLTNVAHTIDWLRDFFRHDASSDQCSVRDYVIIHVAARLQFTEILETMLTDISPAVRAVAIRHSFILWRWDNRQGFALLQKIARKYLRPWTIPRTHILESVIGLSLAILFDAYQDRRQIKLLRELWQTIIENLFFINPRNAGKQRDRVFGIFRTGLLKVAIGFAIKAASETPADTILDIPELRQFFKRDGDRERRRRAAQQLCAFMDPAKSTVEDLYQFSSSLIDEHDLFIAILAQIAWRKHVLETPHIAIPLLRDVFERAIALEKPGPFSNMVFTFAIPLEEELLTPLGRQALSYLYQTINEKTQGKWWSKLRQQRWPGLIFYCMAQNGKSREMPLCPQVKKIVDNAIRSNDEAFIMWILQEELRNALVELRYYRYGLDVLSLFVKTPAILDNEKTREAVVELLSRLYVYEPELVENFLEQHNLVQQFARPVKTNIPDETIGDLINYRAAMFWLEVIMNQTTAEEWRSFIWFFSKLADSSRIEEWSLNVFKFIVNEIYGKPVFFGVPFTEMVNRRLAANPEN